MAVEDSPPSSEAEEGCSSVDDGKSSRRGDEVHDSPSSGAAEGRSSGDGRSSGRGDEVNDSPSSQAAEGRSSADGRFRGDNESNNPVNYNRNCHLDSTYQLKLNCKLGKKNVQNNPVI